MLEPEGLQFYKKETPTQPLCCEYCKIFKSNYFEEHLGMCASVVNYSVVAKINIL